MKYFDRFRIYFTIFNPKKLLKIFGAKIVKTPEEFELMTYSLVVNPLTHCTTPLHLAYNIWTETTYIIRPYSIVYFDE